jgi:hypothetical protein
LKASALTDTVIRGLMKEVGFRTYNLISVLKGVLLDKQMAPLDSSAYIQVLSTYQEVLKTYADIAPAGLNNHYVLYQIFWLLGKEEYLIFCCIPSKVVLLRMNAIWKEICEKNDWAFKAL